MRNDHCAREIRLLLQRTPGICMFTHVALLAWNPKRVLLVYHTLMGTSRMGIACHPVTGSVTWQPAAARWTSPDPPCTAVVVPPHEVTLHTMESMPAWHDASSARVSRRCLHMKIVAKNCNFVLGKPSGPPTIAEHAVDTATCALGMCQRCLSQLCHSEADPAKQQRVFRSDMLRFLLLLGAARCQMPAVSPGQWVSHQGVPSSLLSPVRCQRRL
jgi:hypothetical protein